MSYPHGKLTPEQIRMTYFVVPDLGIALAYGPVGFKAFVARKESLRGKGGDLILIAWPDATMLELKRPDANQELDVEEVAAFYYLFHVARLEREAQGEQS